MSPVPIYFGVAGIAILAFGFISGNLNAPATEPVVASACLVGAIVALALSRA